MTFVFVILTIAVTGVLCLLCFYAGAKVGQAVSRGEDVKLPSVSPIKAIEERRAQREEKRERERFEVIMRNIENYDGTEIGQEDVPRG